MSPFEESIRSEPCTPLGVLVSEQPGYSVNPTVYKFAKSRQDLLDEAQDNLEKVSKRMKKYTEKGKRPLEFEEGEKVLLKLNSSNLEEIRNKKFQRGLIP